MAEIILYAVMVLLFWLTMAAPNIANIYYMRSENKSKIIIYEFFSKLEDAGCIITGKAISTKDGHIEITLETNEDDDISRCNIYKIRDAICRDRGKYINLILLDKSTDNSNLFRNNI